VTVVAAVLLALVLGVTTVIGRWRGSMLPLMIFHQIQLVVCAVIASRLARDSGGTGPAQSAILAAPKETAGEKP
jgi:sodium/bile acid cotransporter 7